MRQRSWFWHGRFEGKAGGYIPPPGMLAHFLYWLGNFSARIEGQALKDKERETP
jgi:hypothetical protein